MVASISARGDVQATLGYYEHLGRDDYYVRDGEPPGGWAGAANTTRSRVRARVEHVFADQQNAMGGKIVRTMGIARARVKIGMMNLVYNMRRLVQLERMAAAPA